jgi:ubiquinone/menaquinone biosynthesis C-methylase UbiE
MMPIVRLGPVKLPSMSGVSDVWAANHPWATVYDFIVEREDLARVLWKVGIDSDVRLLYAAAEEIARLPEGAAVLDIPCGGGVALRGVFPGQPIRYVAADIAPAMLERTRANAERRGLDQIETAEADVEDLPFADGEFDLVVSFTGMHCFPHPEIAVKEIARVLKPGGALTGSAYLNDTGPRHNALARIGRLGGLMGPSCSRADLEEWLPKYGFGMPSITKSGGISYFHALRQA